MKGGFDRFFCRTGKQTPDLATLQQKRCAAPLSVFFRTGLQLPGLLIPDPTGLSDPSDTEP